MTAAAAGRAGRIEMRRCVIVGLINLIRQHFSLFKEVKNLDFLKVVVRSSFFVEGRTGQVWPGNHLLVTLSVV